MSVVIGFSVFPLDKGVSLSRDVARVIKIIQDSGLPYELNSMGTCVEGEWDEVMAVVGECFEKMKSESDRIYMTLKVDYRKGGKDRISGKVKSLEEKLGRVRREA